MKSWIVVSLFLLVSFSVSAETPLATLTVKIEGIKSHQGYIQAYLFKTKDGFPDKTSKAFKSAKIRVEDFQSSIVINQVPFGTYAVALMHDENGNGDMDINWLGIPTEGYGFSNNATGVMGPPKFNSATFKISTQEKQISIDLVY